MISLATLLLDVPIVALLTADLSEAQLTTLAVSSCFCGDADLDCSPLASTAAMSSGGAFFSRDLSLASSLPFLPRFPEDLPLPVEFASTRVPFFPSAAKL